MTAKTEPMENQGMERGKRGNGWFALIVCGSLLLITTIITLALAAADVIDLSVISTFVRDLFGGA
ncbi:MAG: hypothetical protein HY318_17880 [Armatimonadetes bacterium]|nr:hypothetical protein [Armatimonadota bacterium]